MNTPVLPVNVVQEGPCQYRWTYYEDFDRNALACPYGSYAKYSTPQTSSSMSSVCTYCPGGQTTSQIGSWNISSCHNCTAGQSTTRVSTYDAWYRHQKCTDCPAGK